VIATMPDTRVRCERCGKLLAILSGSLSPGSQLVVRCPRCGADCSRAA
jgi:phage FluMu protein Com